MGYVTAISSHLVQERHFVREFDTAIYFDSIGSEIGFNLYETHRLHIVYRILTKIYLYTINVDKSWRWYVGLMTKLHCFVQGKFELES